MKLFLKRCAQDDLTSSWRKFRFCKFHRLSFFIHEASSINESLVNALSSVFDQIFLIENKENVDLNSFNYYHDVNSQCSSRTSLQTYLDTDTYLDKKNYHVIKYSECWKTFDREQHAADVESHSVKRCNSSSEYIDTKFNVNIENSNTNSNKDCLITHDEELYITVIDSLVRSSEEEWKMLKRLQFKNEIFSCKNSQWIVFWFSSNELWSLSHLEIYFSRFQDV